MALIYCKECNKEISSEAGACPHCGFQLKESPATKKSVIIFLIIIATFLGYGEAKRQYQEYKIQKDFAYATTCSVNCKTITGAAELYFEESPNAPIPTLEKLVKEGYLKATPICPRGGICQIRKTFDNKIITVCSAQPSMF